MTAAKKRVKRSVNLRRQRRSKVTKARGSEPTVIAAVNVTMEIHVFSDASYNRSHCGGAYIVGDGQPVHVKFEAANSVEAELLTLEAAVRSARAQHPDANLVVHTDLQGIARILMTLRARGAKKLRDAITECTASILNDANSHAQHQICHRHSRIASGLRGTQHPEAVKRAKSGGSGKQSPSVKASRRRVCLEKLQQLGRAATEHELARLCCLPVGAVHSAMNYLRLHGRVISTPAGWVEQVLMAAPWHLE